MTRLIDADALKKTLCEEYEAREHYSGEIMLKAIDNAPTIEEVSVIEFKEPLPMVKAQKIVKALSNRQQGEWIPVSERWPKENNKYLVTLTDEDYSGNNIHIIQIAYWTGLKWDLDFEECNSVIAWQPLPEPYKGGGSE